MTCPYTLFQGHIIMENQGQRLLLDTGSPATISRLPELRLGSRTFPATPEAMGLDVEHLVDMVGTDFDALVGMDVLGRLDMVIDPLASQVTLTTEESDLEGAVLEIGDFAGVPVVPARVADQECSLFLDTGAWLSYLDPALYAGQEPLGETADFYPFHGRFTVRTCRTAVTLGPMTMTLEAGECPDFLQPALNAAGVRGILGTAVLEHVAALALAPRRQRIAFTPLRS